ncbi:angiopoietin-related protein 1-like [Pecten maximus]|uniref:angiopoietin-related protein 1-like n=1 Tax=Pecten maximus TaxID=6579 RepID=UPI001458D8EA|nr:angiopoietin-related protein 1-like [Pecten maximus]
MKPVYFLSVVLWCMLTVCVAKHSEQWPAQKHLNKGDMFQYKDCKSVGKAGYNESGVYMVWYNSTTPYKVVCQHTSDGFYTVIQQRVNGLENFNRPWDDYVRGFGHTQGDFWAGLNQIYYLTNTGQTHLTVHMQDFPGNIRQINYLNFKVEGPQQWYRLSISNAYGDVPDDLGYNNGCFFYTYDRPDPYGCAHQMTAGWWYNYCTYALPNGQYYHYGPYTPTTGMYNGIFWKDWLGFGYSLKYISLVLSHP